MARIAAAAVLVLSAGAAPAQDAAKFTVNPVMARGPASAAVTIVEFSDYQ